MDSTSPSASFARLARRSAVVGMVFHDLRHTFITRMKEERHLDDTVLADITGHKTLAMLRRYSHPSDAYKVAAVRGSQSSPESPTTEITHSKASGL